jgi:transposase
MNENHKRILKNNFEHIEKEIEEIKLMLRNKKHDFVMYEIKQDVSEERKQEIYSVLKTIMNKISEIKHLLKLETGTEYTSRSIRAMLNDIWITLEESMPKGLKGYGSLNDNDKEFLIHQLSTIKENVKKISEW